APTPPAATPDPESSSTPEPPPPAPAAQTLTFNLVGGSTAISFSASGVQVLWATPNPGFGVEIEPESPGIKVQFESEGHKSRIEAWWSAGPQHEIREEPGG
ncbi:MAG: hypothetical protein OEU32_06255, partial [Acidimicrobiia bacterium]|nr:hypothetical protein [Acidimicrobiia bacterium]